ncbi:MAG: hypothetical protein WD070_00415 [Pirellulaceae bacterium]
MGFSQLLIQFVFRLTFGVALAMAITPSKHVSSGFFRVHLWVLMGLNTFAALAVYSQTEALDEVLLNWRLLFGLAVALALFSYVGSVIWLYEKSDLGTAVIVLVAAGALVAATFATPWGSATTSLGITLAMLDLASSGLLMGVTLSAMFLGHWYLNTPTMELLPLKRLVIFMTIAIAARTLVSGSGLALQSASPQPLDTVFWIFVTFRWLSGLLGTFMLALMTWYTLKVPNTQSATGILYAGVILAFLGELTSLLLSVDYLYPL